MAHATSTHHTFPKHQLRKYGSHCCEGGCGRTVSSNKVMCLHCLALEAMAALEAQGYEYDEQQSYMMLRDAAGI